jgi:hypothetical protein
MPNYQGVWSLSTQYQNAVTWQYNNNPAGGSKAFTTLNQQTTNGIQYVNIATTGNSSTWGSITYGSYRDAGCGSSTRGIIRHGQTNNVGGAAYYNKIEYFTLASQGQTGADFGDATVAAKSIAGLSNSTRGVFAGGENSSENVINTMDYITIASTANATDFGDLSAANKEFAGTASPTRGLFAGGRVVNTRINIIDYITIASTSNTSDFGDLTVGRYMPGALCNGTRAVFGGGNDGSNTNIMDYVTIASTGNATDFGDRTLSTYGSGGTCDSVRGLFIGGWVKTEIDYIIIASTGNATDFGDLNIGTAANGATSDGHGGLS